IVWFLQSFDLKLNPVSDSSLSIMAALSGLMVPLFKPIGLGDWRIITSLISGFMAKESVVSTLEMLYGNTLTSVFSMPQVMSMLVFSLLYTPCVAAVAAIRRELGRKYALGVVFFQCAIAWLCALLTYGLYWGILSK
ncbi:MAG: nucleoside recognition domain-containing protein, partial [Lachnospiraceae bacterium]|nr:nucleoside recognition domain-containing protein [Lachnospiraceae bacterium]